MRALFFALIVVVAGCDSAVSTPAPAPALDAGATPIEADAARPEPPDPLRPWVNAHLEHDFNVNTLDWGLSRYRAETDLVPLAPPTLVVDVHPADETELTVQVTVDDAVVDARPVEPGQSRFRVQLPADLVPPGPREVKVSLLRDATPIKAWSETVTSHFVVAALAADPVRPDLVWAAVHPLGLVALSLDDDGQIARATLYFGHALDSVDALPPRGRPWQGEDGYDGQTEPAGLLGATLLPTADGVYFGAFYRGVSYLAHAGTPHDRSDDAYRLFHPGMHRDPESGEAGRANCPTDLALDDAGGLWIGTLDGVFHVSVGDPLNSADDGWTVFDDPNIEARVGAVVLDGDRVWVANRAKVYAASGPRALAVRVGDAWHAVPLPEPAAVYALLRAEDGALWLGTSQGLWRLEPGDVTDPADDRWTAVTLPAGLGADVRALALGPDGAIWAGLRAGCAGRGGLVQVAADCAPCAAAEIEGVGSVSRLAPFGDRVLATPVDPFTAPVYALLDGPVECPPEPDGLYLIGEDGVWPVR